MLAFLDRQVPYCSLDFKYGNGLVAHLSWHQEVLEVRMGFNAEIEPEALERWNKRCHLLGCSPVELEGEKLVLKKEIENPKQPLALEGRIQAVVHFGREGQMLREFLAFSSHNSLEKAHYKTKASLAKHLN